MISARHLLSSTCSDLLAIFYKISAHDLANLYCFCEVISLRQPSRRNAQCLSTNSFNWCILVYRQEAVLINVYHCFKAMSSLFGLMSMSVSAFFLCKCIICILYAVTYTLPGTNDKSTHSATYLPAVTFSYLPRYGKIFIQ